VVLVNLMVQLVLQDLILLVHQTRRDLLQDQLILADHSDLVVPVDPEVH